MITCNRDFHVSIAEAGRNPYYLQLFARLLDEGRRILRLYYYPTFQPSLPHPYITEHEAIIAAVTARDVGLNATGWRKEHADQIVQPDSGLLSRSDRRQDIPL